MLISVLFVTEIFLSGFYVDSTISSFQLFILDPQTKPPYFFFPKCLFSVHLFYPFGSVRRFTFDKNRHQIDILVKENLNKILMYTNINGNVSCFTDKINIL